MIKISSIVKDSSSKKAVVFFLIPAEGREVGIFILHGRKLNSKGQLNNKRQLNNEGQLNNKGQLNSKGRLVKKSSDVFFNPGRRPGI